MSHIAAQPFSFAVSRWTQGLVALLMLSFTLAGCGGGGGGGGSGAPGASDVLKVTVTDTFGAGVAGATVKGPLTSSITDHLGVAALTVDGSKGNADLAISRATFVDKSVTATINAGQANEIAVTLDRVTLAAGSSLASRSGFLPTVNGTEMTFEIEVVVVGGNSQPIEGLTLANFTLRSCTPDAANNRADCVRGPGADSDVAYAPATSTPETLALIPGQAAMPYAAALLLDQSGSIQTSDPTGARLFSAKAFLQGMGTDDRALLAAFAGGPGAKIRTAPLAVYGPFRDKAAATTAPSSYFPDLDGLSSLVGGDTPLYDSVDTLRQQVVSDAPAGLGKALVVFTDGADTYCGDAETCRTRRKQSIDDAKAAGVRLFTIGLSSGVDIVALGELANQTGGAFLYADSPEQLLPLYGSVGKLLSLSLPTYRLRWTVQAGTSGVFQPGSTLVARVQVTTNAGTFDVPFTVGIP
ncbi:MAG: vWA domain-containing protein [Pseudomonadota bacterium]